MPLYAIRTQETGKTRRHAVTSPYSTVFAFHPVQKTGALLPMARGSFSETAGLAGIIPASSAHAKNDLMVAR